MVYREVCTEGSETAKSGTDEQERHKRLFEGGKQAHLCDARNQQPSDGRCRRNRMKEYVLTWGDLHCYGLAEEKSAEVIVVNGHEPAP